MNQSSRKGSLDKGTLLIIALVALIALIGVLEAKSRILETQLQRVTVRLEQMQGGSTKQNQEKASKIVRKVRILMEIGDVEPTVATIIDVEALRKRNPFYNKAENGDYLIVTPERAILYREETNRILDVVPVQLKPAGGQNQ